MAGGFRSFFTSSSSPSVWESLKESPRCIGFCARGVNFQHLTPFRIENPLGLQIFKDVLVECRDNNGPARRMFLDELVDAQADIFR